MKFKVGDKVKIKSLDWYNANKDEEGNIIFEKNGYYVYFSKYDVEYCGKVMTISDISNNCYIFKESQLSYLYCDEMIECLVERNGKTYPYKIGDRVILKGNNRFATITDLKYNSWGNLSYYVKIDNDKDISVDYPTSLLLHYDNNDNVVEDVANEPQDKMVSLEDVCKWLENINTDDYMDSGIFQMYDMIQDFRKTMEE